MRPNIRIIFRRLRHGEEEVSVVVAVELLDSLGSEAVEVGEEAAGLLEGDGGSDDLTRAEDVC